MNKPCERCIGTGVNVMHGQWCADCGGRGWRQQDQPKPAEYGLHWHALNYRTAHPEQAMEMWLVLEAFVDGMIAQAVKVERERIAMGK